MDPAQMWGSGKLPRRRDVELTLEAKVVISEVKLYK